MKWHGAGGMALRAAFALALASGVSARAGGPGRSAAIGASKVRQVVLHDGVRHRDVPVLLYSRDTLHAPQPLAVISHGYGVGPEEYGFVARLLVERGYLVASVSHVELPGDRAMANGEDLARRRRPVWQIGAESIAFVIGELRREGLANGQRVIAIGHSNGGDMTMLLATTRPDLLERAISLDNRRMPIPRIKSPAICTIRSVDQMPDTSVLPTLEQVRHFRILVIPTTVKHDDMNDTGDIQDRIRLIAALRRCLTVPMLGKKLRSVGRART